MADKSQLDTLKQGVKAWNEWRMQNHSIKVDLSEAELSGANLTISDFYWAKLSGANLTKANLRDAELLAANFSGANCTDTDLTGAALASADLTEVNFSRAILSWVDLSWADLSGAMNLTQKQIEQARGNEQTKLPDHLAHPASWRQS
jgi:uncharacterized protein YjbI with pentapeptide repeats